MSKGCLGSGSTTKCLACLQTIVRCDGLVVNHSCELAACWQQKMNVRFTLLQKGLFLIAIPLVLQTAIIATLFALNNQAEQAAARAEHARRISEGINRLSKDIYENIPSASNSDMSAVALFIQRFDQFSKIITTDIEELKKLVKDTPEHGALIAGLDESWSEALTLLKQVKCQFEDGTLDLQDEVTRKNHRRFRRLIKRMFSDAVLNIASQQREIAERGRENEAEYRAQSKILLIAGSVLTIVTAMLLSLSFNQAIVKRLCIMRDNSLRLAARQPLNEMLSGTDEMAEVDRVFHHMAEAIEEAAQKERALIENARDVICSLDSKLSFNAANEASLKVLGYCAEEIIGSKIIHFLAVDSSDEALDHFQQIMQGQGQPSFETRVRRKDGKVIDVLCSAQWSPSEQSIFCVLHDISERKRAERLRQQVLEMVSHDLKTPLSSISNSLEMLGSAAFGPFSEPAQKLINAATRSSKKMLVLVRDLLEIERIESGMLELHKTETSLSGIIHDAIEANQNSAKAREVKLETSATDLVVYADGNRLEQVLTNLLSNAIKFSPRNSAVTVSAKKLADSTEISVSDTGRGVPEHLIGSIFNRFQQVQESDAREKGGSGLGLAICKALIDLHGGDIRVDSVEGQGSRFSFRIPDAS